MDCSNGNQVGSTCRISCPSRFAEMNIEITPSFSNKITCLPNGKWNHPIPNCRGRNTIGSSLKTATHAELH